MAKPPTGLFYCDIHLIGVRQKPGMSPLRTVRPSPEQRHRKLIEGSVVRHEWDPFESALGRKEPIEGIFVRVLEAAGEERVGTRDRELRC